MDLRRVAGPGDVKAHSKTHRAPYRRQQAPKGAPGVVGVAELSPHLGRPCAANPCTVFGVGFAVGVDVERRRGFAFRLGSSEFPQVRVS